jgi:hypothetical protein
MVARSEQSDPASHAMIWMGISIEKNLDGRCLSAKLRGCWRSLDAPVRAASISSIKTWIKIELANSGNSGNFK